MSPVPEPPGPRPFTIGAVLALAGRSFARRALPVLLLSIAGALLANIAVDAMLRRFAISLGPIWGRLGLEMTLTLAAIAFLLPAILLLLGACRNEHTEWRRIGGRILRRAAVFIPVQVAVDAIVMAPLIVAMPMLFPDAGAAAVLAMLVVYQLPLLAFNYVFMPTLAAESGGPLSSLARAKALISGHWLRMLGIAIMMEAMGGVLVFLQTPLTVAVVTSFGIQHVWLARSLILAFRLTFVASICTAAYHRLCLEKEGGSPEETVQVFD